MPEYSHGFEKYSREPGILIEFSAEVKEFMTPDPPLFTHPKQARNVIPRSKMNMMHKKTRSNQRVIILWRKGWDSNPRTGSSPITRFRVERVTASSLPFHKRVLYTKSRLRASLFSGAAGGRKSRPARADRPFSAQQSSDSSLCGRCSVPVDEITTGRNSEKRPRQAASLSLSGRTKKDPLTNQQAFQKDL